MKKMICLCLMLASTVHGTEVKVMNILNLESRPVDAEFQVNKELGRAWVEIAIGDFASNRQVSTREIYRQKVTGLSFDQATSTIVLEHEGQLVECAKVITKGRSIFRHDVIRNTNCKFATKAVTIIEDDGFDVRRVKAHQLNIVH